MEETKTHVFTAFAQYFVEAPLAPITASSLFEYDAPSLAHLFLGSFSHSSLQDLSSSIRLDGKRRCTAIFRSLHRCSIGFKSGLWLGHSRTLTEFVLYPLLCYIGCVLRVVVLLEAEPSPQSEVQSALEHVFIKDIDIAAFIFPSILTSLPVPAY